MKKIAVSALLLVGIIAVTACQKVLTPVTPPRATTLSEMQVGACNIAHDAGTCDTRLLELGIVIPEECCKALGKCC